MRLTSVQIERMVRRVFEELKSQNIVKFKEPEDKVFKRAIELCENEFKAEAELDREVNRMLDDLERQNPNGFQRSKMFGMIKRRLAKEKGFIL
ncbi:MAG TPA: DUF507 family protein [Bdellovibrionales bacterium]|nr:DUF507 family protein [Bdellovibrionales bacterium]